MRYRLNIGIDLWRPAAARYLELLLEFEIERHRDTPGATPVWWTLAHTSDVDLNLGGFREGGVDHPPEWERRLLVWRTAREHTAENLTCDSAPVSLEFYDAIEGALVMAECSDPELDTLFRNLLFAISDSFPEAVDQLKRQGFDFQDRVTTTAEARRPSVPTAADPDAVPFPGFPTTRKALKRWRDSWVVISKLRREYRDMIDDGWDEPELSLAELAAEVRRQVPEWQRWDKAPQEDTLRNIIRAGEAGDL